MNWLLAYGLTGFPGCDEAGWKGHKAWRRMVTISNIRVLSVMAEIIGTAKLENSVSLQPRNIKNGKKENQSIPPHMVRVGSYCRYVPRCLAQ
jgi:hypothetical protein